MARYLPSHTPVGRERKRRQWSQAELARRADIPRTTVSAIEGERLTPSVTAALALAHALECSVEELFGSGTTEATKSAPEWAWQPHAEPGRYWEASVRGRRLLYPAESLALNAIPHDGIWRGADDREPAGDVAENTLVLACCDPAAGLLATEYARSSGFRLIVFSRSGGEAVDLLKHGLVHVAGLHRSTKEQPGRNAETVRSQLGEAFRLVRVADWQEGLAVGGKTRSRSPASVARGVRRWALREQGSAARECLEELQPEAPGRTVHSHTAVAEAIRGGWAEAGVCVRLAAEEAGLGFLPLRSEALDLCFPAPMQHDARIQALLRLLRSGPYRRIIGELPGYDARNTGEVVDA
jgi:molybdate-binding protein/DNA-binding XRE family transcriptional regulator